MKKLINTAFEEFLEATFPNSLPLVTEEQKLQLKMAFFGGAIVTENLITEKVLNHSEYASAMMIFNIQEELMEFGNEILKKNETPKETPVLTRLDNLQIGDTFKYNLGDAGTYKVLRRADENWIECIRIQSFRKCGSFPWTEVYPVHHAS